MEISDQPATTDIPGRDVYAKGLAALLLNPNVKSPITVGICGDWGKGKSSLMIQTEIILLKARIHLALQNLGCEVTRSKMDHGIVEGVERLLDCQISEIPDKDLEYQLKYRAALKYLAWYLAFIDLGKGRKKASLMILTVTYNAWLYRDEHQAWAGLAVQIIKEIERTMTNAQKISTAWRYAWKNNRRQIWIQVFLPCLLASVLAGWIGWAAWLLLDRSQDKQLKDLKYGSIPATVVGIVWLVLQSVMAVVKPISAQMLAYMRLPDHTTKLGYQQKVIEDITFLKKEIVETPFIVSQFIAGEWFWNWFGLCDNNVEGTTIPKMRADSTGKKPSVFCRFASEWCRNWFGFRGKNVQDTDWSQKRTASDDSLRILVFVDDLDRCEVSVILKVLSAINLVLATCKIDVILGMDKDIVKQAITTSFRQANDTGSARELAERYISKIIQLPLDLPDLSAKDSKAFYDSLLGANQCAELPRSSHSSAYRVDTNESSIEVIDHPPHYRQQQGIVTIRTLKTAEQGAFRKLMEYAAAWQRLPRECKRFVNYYRLASHIVYESEDFKKVQQILKNREPIGRRVQMMTWIFVFWGWKTEIETLLQDLTDRRQQNEDGGAKCTAQVEPESVVEKPSLATLVNRYYDKTWPKEEKKENQSQKPTKGKPKDSKEAKWKVEREEERERRRQRWLKLKEPLEHYDVSWEGIHCFRQFPHQM